MVHSDNLKFLSEKQVFSDAFYKCTFELLQMCIAESLEDSYEMIYQILDRVIWDLLVNSSSNKQLSEMSDLLIVLLSKKDHLIYNFISDRAFLEVHKDDKNYFEMLATHSDKDVRETCAKILLFSLCKLLHMEGSEEERASIIEKSIVCLLDLMP
jgi:hypothetical protein